MKKTYYIILTILALVIAFLLFRNNRYRAEIDSFKEKHYYDTSYFEVPVPVDSVVLKYVTVKVPVVDEDTGNMTPEERPQEKDTTATLPKEPVDSSSTDYKDSVNVIIPITQKEYKDSLYRIGISGYMPNLDYVEIYTPKYVPPKDPWLQWSLSIQVGYGWYGKWGFYGGIGISYGIPLRKFKRR